MGVAVAPKLKRAAAIGCALLALGVAAVAAPNAWVARATSGRAFASAASAPSRSVAIVPGARVHGGKPFVHLEARLQVALSLYQTGRVKAILVSGNQTAESPEVAAMTTWLLEHGVAAKDILADDRGARTRDTMDRAAGVYDVHDAIICTQDVNTARSLYLADQAGIDAVAVAAPSTLARSAKYMRDEALKTALAFFESLFAGSK
jgi:vancomycin permeability regulator SanA